MPSPALSWVSFAVLSAIFLGIYDVAKKASVQDNAVLVVLFACSASGLALFLPLAALSLAAPAWAHCNANAPWLQQPSSTRLPFAHCATWTCCARWSR